MFESLYFTELCVGATILHGERHGLLISMQRLSKVISHRTTTNTSVTVRKSSYRMEVYNIDDRYVDLFVAYVTVESDEPPISTAVSTLFNIPIFLYDRDNYQIVMVDQQDGCKPYLSKIHIGVKDKEADHYNHVFPGLNFQLDATGDYGCFQCWEEGCDFPY